MSTVNFQQRIIEELNVFFEPIIDINGNEGDIVEFFDEFGYDIKTLTGNNLIQTVSALSSLVTATNAVNNINGDNLLGILDTINAFKSLISIPNTISNLKNGFPNNVYSILDPSSNLPVVNDIPKHFLNHLLIKYLFNNHPKIFRSLELLGIIYFENSRSVIFNNKTIRNRENVVKIDLDKLGQLIGNTNQHFRNTYLPNTNGITDRKTANYVAQNVFTKIAFLLWEMGATTSVGNGSPNFVYTQEEQEILDGMITLSKDFWLSDDVKSVVGLKAGLIPDIDPNKQGVFFAPFGAISIMEIIGKWMIAIKASAQSSGMEITGEGITFYDPSQSDFKFALSTEIVREEGDPVFHIGSMTGTRFEVDKMAFSTFLELMLRLGSCLTNQKIENRK